MRTDAALLAADPWSVIEGLVIAAFAVGATEAILAVRADDPALVTLLEGAASWPPRRRASPAMTSWAPVTA